MFGFMLGRYMLGADQLFALVHLQVDIETPQAVQVFQHFLGGVAQRFTVMLLVAQGQ